MKLLVLSTNGAKKDGITSWIIQVFSQIDRAGLEIVDTVAYEGTDRSILDQLDAAGVRTHTLPSRKTRPLAYARALRRLLKQNSYDLFHINGNSGTVAVELLCCLGIGIPARVVHSRNTKGTHPAYDKLLRPAMSALGTDRLACGQDAGEWLFGKKPFTVIPNGRDFDRYSFSSDARARVRADLKLSTEHLAVGHVGNFNEQKNHQFLVEVFSLALKNNPYLRLFLIGDGALQPEVEEQVRRLGLDREVEFLGRSSKVPEYLSAFDLGVLPSLYEGFPNVAIEWQISGLPSIISTAVTDECAVTDLVKFVPADDKSAWAHEIATAAVAERVSSSREAQQLLKEAGYDVTNSAERLRTVYETIARREGLPSPPSPPQRN